MRITRFEDDGKRSPDWPWWTFVEAISWIVSEEDPSQPNDPFGGDLDWSAHRLAAKELRTTLARGRITAYGLRSEFEKPEKIDPVEWATREVYLFDAWWLSEPYRGFVVSKEDVIRLWPVSFASDGEKRVARSGRGRRKGSGTYERADEPFLTEMRSLMINGEASSAYAAANLVLGRKIDGREVAGAGTDDAKRKRLVARYKERFGELT